MEDFESLERQRHGNIFSILSYIFFLGAGSFPTSHNNWVWPTSFLLKCLSTKGKLNFHFNHELGYAWNVVYKRGKIKCLYPFFQFAIGLDTSVAHKIVLVNWQCRIV